MSVDKDLKTAKINTRHGNTAAKINSSNIKRKKSNDNGTEITDIADNLRVLPMNLGSNQILV